MHQNFATRQCIAVRFNDACTCKADQLAQVEGLELAQPEQAGRVDEADEELALHAVRALQQVLRVLAHEILDCLQCAQNCFFTAGTIADAIPYITRLCARHDDVGITLRASKVALPEHCDCA